MSSIKNVTIIGSKSVLTQPIVSTLLPAGFNITILSRAETTVDPSSFPSEVTLNSADYSSHDSLVKAFDGTDVIISLVGPPDGYSSQIQLIDAAISAGVKRFIPSEFGSDFENEKVQRLPLFADKFAVEEHIAKAHKESGLEYDLIMTGLFLEIGLIHDTQNLNVLGLSIPHKTADFLDGGNIPISLSTYPFIASAILSILQRPASNGFVRVWNVQKTARELLAIIQEYTSTEGWTYSESNSDEIFAEAKALLEKPEGFWQSAGKQVKLAAGGRGWGNDFKNDNEKLGLKAMSDEELKEIIKEAVEAAGVAAKK